MIVRHRQADGQTRNLEHRRIRPASNSTLPQGLRSLDVDDLCSLHYIVAELTQRSQNVGACEFHQAYFALVDTLPHFHRELAQCRLKILFRGDFEGAALLCFEARTAVLVQMNRTMDEVAVRVHIVGHLGDLDAQRTQSLREATPNKRLPRTGQSDDEHDRAAVPERQMCPYIVE